MAVVGRVESLWRYPVKSMRGEQLREAFLGFGGVYGDRVYAFRSPAAPKGFPYLTAREQRRMVLFRPVFRHRAPMAAPPNLPEAEAIPQGATPIYPEPDGFSSAQVSPEEAYYSAQLREFVLPYEAVRSAADPDGALLSFLQSTYEAAATLGAWDRGGLEQGEAGRRPASR